MRNQKVNRKIPLAAVILLVAAILGIYTAVIYHWEYERCFDWETTGLSGYHKDVCSALTRKVNFDKDLTDLVLQSDLIELRMAMANLSHMTDESVESLIDSPKLKDYAFDYYHVDGKLCLTAENAQKKLNLSQEKLAQLVKEGYLADSERCYLSQAYDGGYTILARDRSEKLSSLLDYDLTKIISYVIWDQSSGAVLDSYQDGTDIDFEKLTEAELQIENLTFVGSTQISRMTCGGQSYLAASSVITPNDTEMTVCTFIPDGGYTKKAAFYAACALTLGILFVGACVCLMRRLKNKPINENNSPRIHRGKPLTRRHRVGGSMTAMATTFILVSALLFFIQNILQISGEIENGFQNLVMLNRDCTQNQELIYQSATDAGMDYLDDMAYALTYRYEVDTDAWLREMAEITEVDEIRLYDQNGVITHSTAGCTGYSLSSCETDPEYRLWQLLKGGAEHVVFYSEEEERTYMAVRRTDDVGILLMISTGEVLTPLLENMEFADLFTLQDYSDGSRLYFSGDQKETLFLLESGSSIAKIVTDKLPASEGEDMTIGMCEIDGQVYLYIDSGMMDWTFVFAYPAVELLQSLALFVLISAAMYLLISAVLFFAFGQVEAIAPSAGGDAAAARDFDAERKLVFQKVLSILALTSAVMLILKNAVCNDSLMFFSFLDCWQEGVNLISLILIGLFLALCAGLVLAIGFLNGMLCRRLTPKKVTVCTLLATVIKAVLIVTFLIASLEQLGVNATAITASLGLTGLALSIGSKDIISDLVAGLFIAFEGQIQLGDYVEVNGFTGKITAMGIRTTKVQWYNKEMIINNTNMKNVLNYSRGKGSFFVSVVLPYDTDIERLRRIIEASNERFAQACAGALQGRIIPLGVTGYKNYGMEYGIAGTAEPEKAKGCITKCNTELIKILQENGIQPAVGH